MKHVSALILVLGFTIVGGAIHASDAATMRVALHIEPQPVRAALKQFSDQSGVQVLLRVDNISVDGVVTPQVNGELTVQAALEQLLANSGLKYEFVNDRTVRVSAASAESSKVNDESKESSRPLELVRAQSASPQTGASSNPSSNSNAGSPNSELTEVVVTAQKREERLQDVPISMSVLSGEALDRSTARDVIDALRGVPGVALHEASYAGVTQVPIRGVAAQGGNTVDGGPSPTAYYLDSVPFGFVRSAFAPAADAYDLERVEVLRGPQGTLYGANALNGVVRVLTKDANPDKFEFKARGLTSTTKDGGENYRTDMAVNVPIIAGKLAARAVLGYQDLSGWIDKPNDKDANDVQRRNMRLKINAQPTKALSIGVSAGFSRADYGAMASGNDNGQNSSLLDEPIAIDYDVYGLTIGYDFQPFSVTSNTSYLEFANNLIYNAGPRGVPGGLSLVETLDAKTFAQEIAINSTHQGAWRWTAGAMYRDSEDGDYGVLNPPFATPVDARQTSQSYAVFGELTRRFIDGRLEFTAGLRYFEDKVAQREQSRWTPFTANELVDVAATFNATTPRFILAWHANEHMTAYASYSEGFRSGFHQFSDVIVAAGVPVASVEPDRLTNYEVGAKGSLLGGRLNFDTAIFYIDWQDIQQSLNVPVSGVFLPLFINSESASGVGFDFGLTATPLEALELGFNVSWSDLTLDEDIFDSGVLFFGKGDRINNSAEYTVGTSADYIFPVGSSGYEGRFSVSANYTSELPFRQLLGGVVTVRHGGPLLLGRAGVSIQSPSHWTASVFVDNLTDESDPTMKAQPNPDRWVRVRPRTFGVQFEYRFE